MSHFRYVLTHPIFARWFARVHPFFWPVLYWQMGRIIRWMEATGHMDLLVRIHWWGGITVAYTGDKEPDPATYKPLPRTFRPLTDDSWVSDLPVDLDAPFILPRFSGGGGIPHRGMTVGALCSMPDTS